MIMPFEGTHDEAVEDMYPPVTTAADEFPIAPEDEAWYLAHALTTPPVMQWDSPEFLRIGSEVY